MVAGARGPVSTVVWGVRPGSELGGLGGGRFLEEPKSQKHWARLSRTKQWNARSSEVDGDSTCQSEGAGSKVLVFLR